MGNHLEAAQLGSGTRHLWAARCGAASQHLKAHAACAAQVLTPFQALSISANAQPYLADYAQIVEWVVEGGEET